MKRVVFFAGLILAFLALPLLLATQAAAQAEEDIRDLAVDELGPFEEADPDKVGISEVKVEQLKRAEHTIVRSVRPPRIKGDRLQDFDAPSISVRKVPPFDRRDLLSPLTPPFATEKELAAAIDLQDFDEQLEGRRRVEDEHGLSADAKIVHIPTEPKEIVRFGNRRNPDLSNFQFGGREAAEADIARDEAATEAEDMAFEFNHMAGTDQFSGNIHGISGATQPMSVQSGAASLDRQDNLQVSVNGLRHADGKPAAGQRFGAGVACMDSGYFRAGGEHEDSFTVDDSGNGSFTGKLDFAGQSCMAPIPMIMNEEGSFVAVGAHRAAM